MTETEIATVRAAIDGDPEAFRTLVENYHRIVLGAVYRLLAPRTPQDAEDIAQEIFVKLSRAISTFDFAKQTKFSTWFYTFVRNHCFDVMKKRRLKTVSLSGGRRHDDKGDFELPSKQGGPVQATQSEELRALLSTAIGNLPEEERSVFVMREIDGREYDEIAHDLGIAEGTAKGRLYRAKESLRTMLSPYLRDGSVGGMEGALFGT